MTPLDHDQSRRLHEEIKARNARQEAAELAAARAEAERRGKEPFDLAALEMLADTRTSSGHQAPLEERQRRYEFMYYVTFPELRTMAELASRVNELSRW